MRVLTIHLNGCRLCTVGAKEKENISASATMIGNGEDGTFLQVSGFDGVNDFHLDWCFQQLKLGDEIRITVQEKPESDQPKDRKSVEEMDQWARSLNKNNKFGKSAPNDLHPLPAPWE